jgi:hypothetical protein
MSVEYLAKAKGTLVALARPESAAVESASGYAWPVVVSVRNEAGEDVFRARIDMWVSPRKAA